MRDDNIGIIRYPAEPVVILAVVLKGKIPKFGRARGPEDA